MNDLGIISTSDDDPFLRPAPQTDGGGAHRGAEGAARFWMVWKVFGRRRLYEVTTTRILDPNKKHLMEILFDVKIQTHQMLRMSLKRLRWTVRSSTRTRH